MDENNVDEGEKNKFFAFTDECKALVSQVCLHFFSNLFIYLLK